MIGPGWSIDFGKAGQVDFLGIGSGKDAWEAFAKDSRADQQICTTLHVPDWKGHIS